MNFCIRIPHAVHQPVNAPDHVGLRKVDQEHPKGHEETDSGEFHPLGNGANDQGWSDNGEHQLVHRVNILRHPIRIIAIRSRIDAVEKQFAQAAIEGSAFAENHTVTTDPPENCH